MASLTFLSNVVWIITFAFIQHGEIQVRVLYATVASALLFCVGLTGCRTKVLEHIISFVLSFVYIYYNVMVMLNKFEIS